MAPRAARCNTARRKRNGTRSVVSFSTSLSSPPPQKRANVDTPSLLLPPKTHLISSIPMMVYDKPIVAGMVHSGPQAPYIANGIMFDHTNNSLDA